MSFGLPEKTFHPLYEIALKEELIDPSLGASLEEINESMSYLFHFKMIPYTNLLQKKVNVLKNEIILLEKQLSVYSNLFNFHGLFNFYAEAPLELKMYDAKLLLKSKKNTLLTLKDHLKASIRRSHIYTLALTYMQTFDADLLMNVFNPRIDLLKAYIAENQSKSQKIERAKKILKSNFCVSFWNFSFLKELKTLKKDCLNLNNEIEEYQEELKELKKISTLLKKLSGLTRMAFNYKSPACKQKINESIEEEKKLLKTMILRRLDLIT